MVAVVVFFAALALLALWACWRDSDLFWVGLWLVGNCVLSNIIQFGFVLPIEDPAARLAAVGALKPGLFTFVEAMTAVAVFCAWTDYRHYSPGIARSLIALIMCNTVSICFNVALAAYFPPDARQVFLYEATTNLIFTIECLLAFGIGVAHGVWSGRFSRWPRLSRRAAKPHAARAKGGPAA
jgi:hypothetical protein